MKSNLESCKNVLRSFLSEIAEVEEIRKGISSPIIAPFNIKDRTPDFSNVEFSSELASFWEEDNAYTWIYAEPWHYRQLMLPQKNNSVPGYYLQPAQPIYQDWLNEEKEVTYRGTIISEPLDVNLNAYLTSLAECIHDGNEKRTVWIKSLKSFLQYIRNDTPFELQGTLDCIFPYKMEIRRGIKQYKTQGAINKREFGLILRNIEEPVYPIDILAAAEILQNLTKAALEGRPNGQHSAAEALGFAWICHAAGSARLMTQEKAILRTPLTSLKSIDLAEGSDLKPNHFITIQTIHGFKDIPISKTLYNFLIALPRAERGDSIFSKPISTLLRTLYLKGVGPSEQAKSLGKITFCTFMSQSTHWHGHRPGQRKVK